MALVHISRAFSRAPVVGAVLLGASASSSGQSLPLGDGATSSGPLAGHLYSCQQRFNPNAPGARGAGAWIQGGAWYPQRKVFVEGNVRWPNAKIDVFAQGDRRIVRANNLPTHATGSFPIARSSTAYRYDRNPNAIREQQIVLELPRDPSPAKRPSCVPMGLIGIMLSGAALFSAIDARGEDAPAHEIQDRCNGHPEQSGSYHYHNASPCLEDTRSQPGGHSDLVGYAIDGFGIYGPHGENGREMTTARLDACHGHTHETQWDGERRTTFHYHLTRDYPYSIGCFRGTPVRGARAAAPRRPPRRRR